MSSPINRYMEGYTEGHRKGMEDCEQKIAKLRAALRQIADHNCLMELIALEALKE